MLILLICIIALTALTIVVGVALTLTRTTYSGRAEGIVYRSEKSSDVSYRYTDNLQKKHEGRSQLVFNKNPFPTGMRVVVRYDPKNAEKFYVEEERRMQTKIYTIVIVALLSLLLVMSSIYVISLFTTNNKEEVIYNESGNDDNKNSVP